MNKGRRRRLSIQAKRRSDRKAVLFEVGWVNLPITHKDFTFATRTILVSRRTLANWTDYQKTPQEATSFLGPQQTRD